MDNNMYSNLSLTLADMKAGLHYIVTNHSVDGSFQVGDRIQLIGDGDVLNNTTSTWMKKARLKRATKGMTVALNKEWLQSQHYETAQSLWTDTFCRQATSLK